MTVIENIGEVTEMNKMIILAICSTFAIVSLCFASDLKKVDNPTLDMLQGKWEGRFERTGRRSTEGPFEMKFKGNKAIITRGATYTDPITKWVAMIDKIEGSKIFMSSKTSNFEIELFTNNNAEFFIKGNYTGYKAGTAGMGSATANSDIKLQRTSTTVDDKDVLDKAVKE
jgi:hypothetical protein